MNCLLHRTAIFFFYFFLSPHIKEKKVEKKAKRFRDSAAENWVVFVSSAEDKQMGICIYKHDTDNYANVSSNIWIFGTL